MKSEDVGIPFTPFGLIVSRYHGRMDYWREPWCYLPETDADRRFKFFWDGLFPGQSQRQGLEERYFCPSPFGDAFDVVVHDAPRDSWREYPVLSAVGVVEWTEADVSFLKDYVESGGTLVLESLNLDGFDAAWLGDASERAVAHRDPEGSSIWSVRRGKGRVFVADGREEPCPTPLWATLADEYLPFRVRGTVEYMINRTPDSWILTLINNAGFRKEPREMPETDPAGTVDVSVEWRFPAARIVDVYRHVSVKQPAEGEALSLRLDPGAFRILRFETAQEAK
jgi:hypothetical protein